MSTTDPLLEQLQKLSGSRTLILGIGNTLKGDDGAGPLICQRLAGKTSADVIDAATVPENYIQKVVRNKPQNLLLVDAVDFGASPGAVRLFNPEQLSSVAFSTHALSPHLFIDMIRSEIDVDIYFIGIQPAHVALGADVSPHVADAVEKIADTLSDIFPLSA